MTATSFSCIHQTAATPGFCISSVEHHHHNLVPPMRIDSSYFNESFANDPQLNPSPTPCTFTKSYTWDTASELKGFAASRWWIFPRILSRHDWCTILDHKNLPEWGKPSTFLTQQASTFLQQQASTFLQQYKPPPSSSGKPQPSSSGKPQPSSSKPPPSSTHPEMAYLLPQLQNSITVVLKVLPLLFSQSALVFKVWFLGLCCISSTLTTSQGFLCLQAHCHSMLMICYSIALSPLGLTLTLCRRTSSTFLPGLQTITWDLNGSTWSYPGGVTPLCRTLPSLSVTAHFGGSTPRNTGLTLLSVGLFTPLKFAPGPEDKLVSSTGILWSR